MEKIIFYFTGTGNALDIAKDLAKSLGDTKVISITSYDTSKVVEADTIGFIFPVYMWGIPSIMKNFIENIKINGSPYIFTIPNFHGAPGTSIKQVKDILAAKGHNLSAGFKMPMPGNYIIMHGASKEEKLKEVLANKESKLTEISENILNKKICLDEASPSLKERLSTFLFYRFIHRTKQMDKKFTSEDTCTGCELCKKICPVQNIEIKDGRPSWNHKCEQCLACIQWCPNEAIQYGKMTKERKRYHNPNVTIKEMIHESTKQVP